MKPNKTIKKLTLNKCTINDLDGNALKGVIGGGTALCIELTAYCDTYGVNSCDGGGCLSNNPPAICGGNVETFALFCTNIRTQCGTCP